MMMRRRKARGVYQGLLPSLGVPIDHGPGSDGFYGVVLGGFGSQVRARFDDELPSVERIRRHVRDALQADFDAYVADATVGKEATTHPITDMLRRRGVDVGDEAIRGKYLTAIGTQDGWEIDAAGHMIDVVAVVFGLTATVLGPAQVRHVGDRAADPMAYVYYAAGQYRAMPPPAVVQPAVALWPVAPVPVDADLSRRVMEFVADHERLTGVDYEAAWAAADDRGAFAADVQPRILGLKDALHELEAEPTHGRLVEVLTRYWQLAERVIPPAPRSLAPSSVEPGPDPSADTDLVVDDGDPAEPGGVGGWR